MINVTCIVCKRDFQTRKRNGRRSRTRFCSMKCRCRFYKSRNVKQKCPQCGKLKVLSLYAYNAGRRHCSRKCMALSMSKHRMDDRYILNYVKAHVSINRGGCWIFTGPSGGKDRHPQMKVDGKCYPVSALVFKAVGKSKNANTIKGKRVYCHSCGEKCCVNPDHTYIGMPRTSRYHRMDKDYVRRLIKKMSIVDPKTKCWWWIGSRTNKGYSQIQIECRHFTGHRLSMWAFKNREDVLHNSKPVCHNCDNPACVNPSHLRVDTQRENILDTIRRGRNFATNKTHCRKGHPYNHKNTIIRKSTATGGVLRTCRACAVERDKKVQREIASRISYLQKATVSR